MNLTEFFFDTPIYQDIEITEDNFDTFKKIIEPTQEEFEGYNPWDKVESTFKVITNLQQYNNNFQNYGWYWSVQVKCKRTDSIFRYYIFYNAENKKLIKVGQHPTVADFHISEVKQYKDLLSNDRLKEFTKAIGLAANWVWIGSFVYLRRIFESLILEAFNIALSEKSVTEEDYHKARMNEKIALLEDYLPPFLVDTKEMYSILSLWIHELDEQTCLAHFDALRVWIEIILDEKLDEYKKQKKVEQAKKKLQAIKGEIKKS